MSEGTDGTTTPTTTETTKDVAYYEAEAKKAFQDRDKAKKELRALQDSGRVLSDEQVERFKALEKAAETEEEERKKKAGEWDTLRESLTKKHATELADRDAKVKAADDKLRRTLIGLAFAGASDVFGRDALTIYTAKAGERIFGEYVELAEDGSAIVRDRDGNVIVDAATGKPASFSAAMKELIESLPDKADHLRGSGKTGSGSSGGSTMPGHQADVTELTERARKGDKAAITALQQRRANSGGLVMGAAFSRTGA